MAASGDAVILPWRRHPDAVAEARQAPDRRTAVAAGLAVGIGIAAVWLFFQTLWSDWGRFFVGSDLVGYTDGARRFIDTGSPYTAEQLAGPWQLDIRSFIHPPIALGLFIPFLVLPALLWWAIPAAILGWALWRLRPAPWTWPVMLLLLCWPRSLGSIIAGNTDIWIMAFVAAAAVLRWPAAFIVIKPSFAPLLLIGVRRRSWWLTMAVLGVISLLMLPLWFEWVTVLRNASPDPLYSIFNLPLVSIGLVAWLGSRDPVLRLRPPARLASLLPGRFRREALPADG